jgi:hypothetical protein
MIPPGLAQTELNPSWIHARESSPTHTQMDTHTNAQFPERCNTDTGLAPLVASHCGFSTPLPPHDLQVPGPAVLSQK